MAKTSVAGLYTSNHGSVTGMPSSVLYSGRGSARHHSGLETCDSSGAGIVRATARSGMILRMHDLWYPRCRWRIAAALNAHCSIGNDHTHSGQVSFLNAVQKILACGLLRRIQKNEARLATCPDQAAVQTTHLRGISGRHADRHFRGKVSER